jgi:hypothetical protein
MFFMELISFIPYAGIYILEFIHSALELGLISLLIGGPTFIIFLMTIRPIFGSTFSVFVGIPLTIASVLWISHLPWVILEYDPTMLEFFAVYIPSVFVVLMISYSTLYWTSTRNQPQIRRPRPHQD